MTNKLIVLFATSLALAACQKSDTASATAVPGEADASAQGEDVAAGAASDEDSASAIANEEDAAASATVEGDDAEASATATDESDPVDDE